MIPSKGENVRCYDLMKKKCLKHIGNVRVDDHFMHHMVKWKGITKCKTKKGIRAVQVECTQWEGTRFHRKNNRLSKWSCWARRWFKDTKVSKERRDYLPCNLAFLNLPYQTLSPVEWKIWKLSDLWCSTKHWWELTSISKYMCQIYGVEGN